MFDPNSKPPIKFLEYFCNFDLLPAPFIAFALALPILFLGLGLLLKPKALLAGFSAFPRNAVAGIVLTAICVPWFALLLYYNIPFPGLLKYQNQLVIGCLLLFFPICYYMKDLLAVRALGCFLLLAGVPVMNGVKYEPGSWPAWLVVGWMYVLVVIGIYFVFSPWRFRRWTNRFLVADKWRPMFAAGFTSVGLVLSAIGVIFLTN